MDKKDILNKIVESDISNEQKICTKRQNRKITKNNIIITIINKQYYENILINQK